MVVMRPWVQYGSSINARGVPYLSRDGPPSQSERPGGSFFISLINAWYSGHCLPRIVVFLKSHSGPSPGCVGSELTIVPWYVHACVNVPSISSSTFWYPE